MKKDVRNILHDSLEKLGVSPCPEIEIEIPREKFFGDLSTPVAMGLAKTLKKAPKNIAEDIINNITDRNIFEKIDIAGAGFINFTFTKKYLHALLKDLLSSGKSSMRTDVGHKRKVLVEFVSANPTGPLHIGHARGAAVGNALCNLLEESGFIVEREYYINDAGRQIKLLGMSVYAKYQQSLGVNAEFPEDGYRGQYIDDEASALSAQAGDKFKNVSFEDCEKEITGWAYNRMMELIKKDISYFSIKEFSSWVSEKKMHENNEVKKAIEYLKSKDFIYEKDGAVWFSSEKFGDDKDRVVIKSDGEHTYFASDIAYHKDKLDRGFDIIIDIWGADHHGYIPRIASVMKAFGYDSSKFKVILVQMVNLLKHGEPFQMSKRAGNFVTLSEVVDLVGADITKFIFLTRKSDSHLDFDIDVVTATSAENPVFYVQYANARINSIFLNAKEKGIDTEDYNGIDFGLLTEQDETDLIKKLLSYIMVIEGAATAFEPHRITFFLQELSGMFHSYYHKHKVITDDINTTKARLALCNAVKVVIKDALTILGVTAPEKM
ncbi:MAG: arginine--tRNA ligase [Nitrospirae bacterium GWC2_42_7]|nr:MAG: arginine--tRNA ligase [Nitrospirae bacterium GWC2_42_7]